MNITFNKEKINVITKTFRDCGIIHGPFYRKNGHYACDLLGNYDQAALTYLILTDTFNTINGEYNESK